MFLASAVLITHDEERPKTVATRMGDTPLPVFAKADAERAFAEFEEP